MEKRRSPATYAELGPRLHIIQALQPIQGNDPDYPDWILEDARLPCHHCNAPRLAIGTKVIDHQDPTTSYKLICGHTTI